MTEPAISAAIDYDEIKTGKRREATYTGFMAFLGRFAIVLTGLTLLFVQQLTGFDAKAETQPYGAEMGIKMLISIVPFIGILVALFIFAFFPINHIKFKEMQQKLKKLHEERLKVFQEENKMKNLILKYY